MPDIYVGSDAIADLKIGDVQVESAYFGDILVWSSAPFDSWELKAPSDILSTTGDLAGNTLALFINGSNSGTWEVGTGTIFGPCVAGKSYRITGEFSKDASPDSFWYIYTQAAGGGSRVERWNNLTAIIDKIFVAAGTEEQLYFSTWGRSGSATGTFTGPKISPQVLLVQIPFPNTFTRWSAPSGGITFSLDVGFTLCTWSVVNNYAVLDTTFDVVEGGLYTVELTTGGGGGATRDLSVSSSAEGAPAALLDVNRDEPGSNQPLTFVATETATYFVRMQLNSATDFELGEVLIYGYA